MREKGRQTVMYGVSMTNKKTCALQQRGTDRADEPEYRKHQPVGVAAPICRQGGEGMDCLDRNSCNRQIGGRSTIK